MKDEIMELLRQWKDRLEMYKDETYQTRGQILEQIERLTKLIKTAKRHY